LNNPGLTSIRIIVTSPDGLTTKKYVIYAFVVNTMLSSDSSLASLMFNGNTAVPFALTPMFDPTITQYVINVNNSATSVLVMPVVNNTGATAYVSQGIFGIPAAASAGGFNATLAVGSNFVYIRVLAANNRDHTTYTIRIIRADVRLNVKLLVISNVPINSTTLGSIQFILSINLGIDISLIVVTSAASTTSMARHRLSGFNGGRLLDSSSSSSVAVSFLPGNPDGNSNYALSSSAQQSFTDPSSPMNQALASSSGVQVQSANATTQTDNSAGSSTGSTTGSTTSSTAGGQTIGPITSTSGGSNTGTTASSTGSVSAASANSAKLNFLLFLPAFFIALVALFA